MGMYLGVDPGMNGAIGVLCDDVPYTIPLKKTEHEIWEELTKFIFCGPFDFAIIERQQPTPKGTIGNFKLGQSYGFLRGLLVARNIPFDEVGPKKWQAYLGCPNKDGNKRISRQKAQQLFPQIKITDTNADAILLALYAKKVLR